MLPRPIIDRYVKFRTSIWYVWSFAILICTWIFLNKTGFFKFDNDELTYLNLILSVLAELQSILLLVYTARLTQAQERADAEERANVKQILAKLDQIYGGVEEITEELVEDDAVVS